MISEALLKNLSVTGLCDDSRGVKAGDLFFAFPVGEYEVFARTAIDKGAVAVVSEVPSPLGLEAKWIQVKSVRDARLSCARIFYKDPFSKLTAHAVTGTNGKTTSAFLMDAILRESGRKVALIGTICKRVGDTVIASNLTTPGLLELYAFAKTAVDAGCSDLVMEASSHSLHQGRVAGITFKSALFSNLTQDHLDYHKTMEAYFEAKKLLFTEYLAADGVSVFNVDDAYGFRLYNNLNLSHKMAVSRLGNAVAQLTPTTVNNTEDGLTMIVPALSSEVLETHFVGDFNADNILLVAGWSQSLGLPLSALRKALLTVHVPGRFDMVWNDKRRRVIVDYAHTPDALERVLRTARSLCRGTLSVVFGCGGDRDRTKRPIMGSIAEKEADMAWVTSDNPRTEDPQGIINEIVAGMHSKKFRVLIHREAAIAEACKALRDGDWLVVAGKGHEDYQIIGRTKHHFDDREVVCEEMKKC